MSTGCMLAIFVAIVVVVVIIAIVMLSSGGTDEWVRATQATGSWTTSVTVFGPQVMAEERWETDCINDPSGTVRAGTCILKDSTTYQDTVLEDYDEYAYNIYYEETWDQPYQAQGTEFVIAELGRDEWWEGNLHHTRVEELDRDSCIYTEYSVWVDDPDDATQEMEVYLSECEVWDHVTVTERIYDQKPWCQCDVVRTVQLGQVSDQGTGFGVAWPEADVPEGGSTERAFSGSVTFLAKDQSFTVTTDDPNQFQEYLTGPYYVGFDGDRPVAVRENPPE
jgi:hypothetical protein